MNEVSISHCGVAGVGKKDGWHLLVEVGSPFGRICPQEPFGEFVAIHRPEFERILVGGDLQKSFLVI